MYDFSIFGFYPVDKGVIHLYLRLPQMTHYEVAILSYIYCNVQNQDIGNSKKGYCYRTKKRMCKELKIGKARLNKALQVLNEYKLIEHRQVPNYRGGHPLEEYKPLPLPSVQQFISLYGYLLSDYDYHYLTKKMMK